MACLLDSELLSSATLAENLRLYLEIAIKTRCKVLFEEALRHASALAAPLAACSRGCSKSSAEQRSAVDRLHVEAREEVGSRVHAAQAPLLDLSAHDWEGRVSKEQVLCLDAGWREWVQENILERQQMDYIDPRVVIDKPMRTFIGRCQNNEQSFAELDNLVHDSWVPPEVLDAPSGSYRDGFRYLYSQAQHLLRGLHLPNLSAWFQQTKYLACFDFRGFVYPWERAMASQENPSRATR